MSLGNAVSKNDVDNKSALLALTLRTNFDGIRHFKIWPECPDRRHKMSWLKRDARNRAWRAFLQAVGATIIIPAGDAALQVVQRALLDSMRGEPFDWREVATSAMWSAGVGVTVAVLAYLHRLKLDPSPFPSAAPPAPPRNTRMP